MQKEIERMQQEKEHAKVKGAALKSRITEISAASVTATGNRSTRAETVTKKVDGLTLPSFEPAPTAPLMNIVVSLPTVLEPAPSKPIATDTTGGPQNLSAVTGSTNILGNLPPVPTFELGGSTLTVATATKTVPTVVPLTTAVSVCQKQHLSLIHI